MQYIVVFFYYYFLKLWIHPNQEINISILEIKKRVTDILRNLKNSTI